MKCTHHMSPQDRGIHDMDTCARLAAIIDSSEDPIISKDLNGIVQSWNRAATRVFGYEPEEMIGQSIRRLIPEDRHHEEDEILRKLAAGERIHHYETVRLKKSGEAIPVSLTISPIRNAAGRIVGASKFARDISEQKKNDEVRFRLAAIVDSAEDAIVSKSLDGIVTSWNDGARRMLGYTAEEMIGRPTITIVPEELQEEERALLQRMRAGKHVDHYETRRRKKDGEIVDVSVTVSPIRDGKGHTIGVSTIARDISDQKRVERLLIQSEKIAATGRMAAAIAHEINNPLESLINLVYLARQSTPLEQVAHQYLITAEGELRRVAHIAQQTLGFYRDTGSPGDTQLPTLIDNVLTVYQGRLMSCGIATQVDCNNLPDICVRRGDILQVFSNIIVNAIDAMPQGGRLCISLRATANGDAPGIETVIQDTGPGIPHESLDNIFEPFFTTKGNLGTGIGLWIAKQLVDRHGGTIAITSSTLENRGTTARIFLPLATPLPAVES